MTLIKLTDRSPRFAQGGVPDLEGTARSILRDWVAGRIAYYTSPPSATATTLVQNLNATTSTPLGTVTDTDLNSATLLTSFAPAFDLAALFGEADAVAFGEGGAAGSSVQGKAVKMQGFEGESEDANVGWITGEGDDEEDEGMDEDEEESIDVEDLIDEDDDEEDEDGMEEDEPVAPVVVKKSSTGATKRSAPQIVSVAPSNSKKAKVKSVSFSSTPLGPTGSGTSTPTLAATANAKSLLSESADDVGLNKNIKKDAKKDKKAKRKAEKQKQEVKEVVKEFGEDADMPAKPRSARVVNGGASGFAEVYDFQEFFGGKQQKTPAAASAAMGDDEEEL